jgi:multidrug efflux pump subunit AcrA (membrane-fusion protein)
MIVLPEDWPQWDPPKLDSVLAHERSHIDRHDPAIQLISAIHRALLWFSPAAWLLHRRIVRTGEEVSDDAAIAVTADRAAYAGILVDFMQRRALPRHYLAVPMSRYGSTDRRIQRILDSSTLSRGITWMGFAAILTVASPLAWFTAAATQSATPAARVVPPKQSAAQSPPARRGPGRNGGSGSPQSLTAVPAGNFLVGLGKVRGAEVTVRTQVEGTLKSLSFEEGQPVHAGDLVAVIDDRAYKDHLLVAASKVNLEARRLQIADERYAAGTEGIDAKLTAQAAHDAAVLELEAAKTRLAATQIKAPISGIAGLRLVEPGNMVRPTDPNGLVVIAEVQPISVLFTLPEKFVQQLREILYSGRHPAVEVWTNDNSTKIARGVLTAMDNQIDPKTGTVTLKATFANKDRKLFPHQFVNVHVLK